MSNLYSLVKSDYIKGAIMFVGSSVIAAIIQMLQAGSFNINWMTVLNVSIISLLTYLSKNFFTKKDSAGTEYLGGKYKI